MGYSSSTSGKHKVYVSCDQEFYEGYLAERGFVYVGNERSAFKLFDSYEECMADFNNIRSLTFHAEKSGKASRDETARAKPPSQVSRPIPSKSFVPKGTCRHCGKTIQFGSVREHELKCATAKS